VKTGFMAVSTVNSVCPGALTRSTIVSVRDNWALVNAPWGGVTCLHSATPPLAYVSGLYATLRGVRFRSLAAG